MRYQPTFDVSSLAPDLAAVEAPDGLFFWLDGFGAVHVHGRLTLTWANPFSMPGTGAFKISLPSMSNLGSPGQLVGSIVPAVFGGAFISLSGAVQADQVTQMADCVVASPDQGCDSALVFWTYE